MYDDYYYEKPTSLSDDSGVVLGAAVGLGVGAIFLVGSVVLFLITRFDILSSALLSLFLFLLTYQFGWATWIYIAGAAVIFGGAMLLQHLFKVARVLFVLFTCFWVAIIGGMWKEYDTQAMKYMVMAICAGVTALLGWISWEVHIKR